MPSASKLATNKFDLVTVRGRTISLSQVHEMLHALPAGAPLSTREAAIFLGYSVSQLERMRIAGTGPRYRQTPPEPGSKATNLHVAYKKVDLVEWDEKNTASSSMEHAVKHGRAFATLADIAQEAPFYVDADGAIESLVESNTVGEAIDRIGLWDIQWLPVAGACARRWSNLTAHRELAAKVEGVLAHARGALAAGLEETEIGLGTPPGVKIRARRVDPL